MRSLLTRGYALVAFLCLLLAYALDASFLARFTHTYAYSAPVRLRDIATVLLAFSLQDVSLGWLLVFVGFAGATIAVLVVGRSWSPRVRLGIATPQLILAPVMLMGVLALTADLPQLLYGNLDGEWFHEGWPVVEAFGVWLPVPVGIATSAAHEWFLARRQRRT